MDARADEHLRLTAGEKPIARSPETGGTMRQRGRPPVPDRRIRAGLCGQPVLQSRVGRAAEVAVHGTRHHATVVR